MSANKFISNLYDMCVDADNAQGIGFSPDGLSVEIRDREVRSI
jgi:hypothetical protein